MAQYMLPAMTLMDSVLFLRIVGDGASGFGWHNTTIHEMIERWRERNRGPCIIAVRLDLSTEIALVGVAGAVALNIKGPVIGATLEWILPRRRWGERSVRRQTTAAVEVKVATDI